jgi:hypothetical protein
MSAFDNAQRFFHACETPLGWEGCKAYVAEGVSFVAQSEPLTEVHTVQAYCEWIKGFGTVTAAGAHYVYILTMDTNDQVAHMVKVWNASWAMRELGWM